MAVHGRGLTRGALEENGVQNSRLLDIQCALCHVTGVQFDKKICTYKSAILDFLRKNGLLLHKMSWGELILPL